MLNYLGKLSKATKRSQEGQKRPLQQSSNEINKIFEFSISVLVYYHQDDQK